MRLVSGLPDPCPPPDGFPRSLGCPALLRGRSARSAADLVAFVDAPGPAPIGFGRGRDLPGQRVPAFVARVGWGRARARARAGRLRGLDRAVGGLVVRVPAAVHRRARLAAESRAQEGERAVRHAPRAPAGDFRGPGNALVHDGAGLGGHLPGLGDGLAPADEPLDPQGSRSLLAGCSDEPGASVARSLDAADHALRSDDTPGIGSGFRAPALRER